MAAPILSRETRLRNDWLMFAIVAAGLVLLNLIMVRVFFRLDLTRTHAYSLAAVSKQYMRDLRDPMTVKAFFTKNLPAPYNSNARYLRDLLEDFRVYSHGRFNYQFIDPADDPNYQKEARSLGVYEIQLTAVAKDQFEQKNGSMGLAVIYGDRHETIPLIQDTSGLEYQLASAIKKLVQSKTKVLGVTQGHGEAGLGENLENFRQLVSQNYDVVPVDLAQGFIPPNVDTLLVAGPTRPLAEDKLYALDAFLREGHNLALLAPMVRADPRATMQGSPVDSGLARLLSAWGVLLEPNLVLDAQCQRIAVAQRGPGFIMQNIVPYPPFPLVTNLNAASPINQNLDSYTLPFVSSLALNETVLKANKLQGEILASSSTHAWELRNFFMLAPQFTRPPDQGPFRQFGLVAAVSGVFPSAFSPAKLPAASRPGEPLPNWVSDPKPARILVIGGADLITNDFVNNRNPDQVIRFVQNAIDWVAQDPALIEIRNKGLEPVSLANVPDLQRRTIKYFNLIGLPILVAAAGFFLWRRQRARRIWIAAQFREK